KPKRHLGPDLEATDLFPSRPTTDILSIDKPNRLKSNEIACYQTDCTQCSGRQSLGRWRSG
ncbi:hypothetical protein, partial [Rhodopirellula bahusiensis]|uniref:hypothetical protein n=1 Tax=Rhodopirellula bahusiensis TaxID=2014065 RepID=UPI003263D2D2